MENPVRKQLNDFIGRRQVTHPQFIRANNMDQYFSSIGVDGQREIVHGLLRCSDLTKISDDIRKKVVHLYNNLYNLKDSLKKRKTIIVVTSGGKQQKMAMIRRLDENQRLMQEIVAHLRDNPDETVQAIINWTISTVNLFGGVYLTNRCEIDRLRKVREQAIHLAAQIREILAGSLEKMEGDQSAGSGGMFASKAKKEVQQMLSDRIAFMQQVMDNLGKTEKLVDSIREPIFLAHRVSRALQAESERVLPDWKSFYESKIKDQKGLPMVAASADHKLKAAGEKPYEKTFATVIQKVQETLEGYRQLLPASRETLGACGVEDEETLQRIIQTSRSLNSILNNLFLELRFAYQNGLNRKEQILRDRNTYEEEKVRTDQVLQTAFSRTLEEVFPADFKNSKAALIDTIHKGITRDEYSLLRSEINFWSLMKDKIFEKGKESKQSMFIRRRRMVNDILPDEEYYIEYSDRLRKTIDIINNEKDGFEPFIQQDFHDLLKYLVSLYRDAESHIRKEEPEEDKEKTTEETP